MLRKINICRCDKDEQFYASTSAKSRIISALYRS